ncbi:LysR family transcriptional regulator ArgP [Aestuariicella hydrocarbonica]|uniref:LysR family transcriptional regulator ArgP n=1 Tax=Pseudomaricurvus hydrocarbonicus TaxID=1470433 RepID=A0A9E5JXW5_9GAMM|nr:LysR family transcriptional regulator ArgP [Aestuariicella hydrocarbonica]NHO66626.1 LysR family transcriptional regulator ArgP [Aestuariicella hydrocarbonica]
MLDYVSLAALAAVIREGSFERAARSLNVTPSAVSQRVRQLEERVGCALVIRETPCRATALGQRLCLHIDRVSLLEQELQSTLPALAAEGAKKVTVPVAVNADSFATWFVPALADFCAETSALMDVKVDDQDHTSEWLRSGKVLAAVTSRTRPATGCNSQFLGTMRYLAAASPSFVQRYFGDGIGADSLAHAPSLVFDTKDELQSRWVQGFCGRHIELPRHRLPSPQAFVTATLTGMGWGLHPSELIADCIDNGSLIELVPGLSLDVPLYWQYTRSASSLLDGLTHHIVSAARSSLIIS